MTATIFVLIITFIVQTTRRKWKRQAHPQSKNTFATS